MDFSDIPSSHLAPSRRHAGQANRRSPSPRLSEARYACRAGEYRAAIPLLDKSYAIAKRRDDSFEIFESLCLSLRASIELERLDRLPAIEDAARALLAPRRVASSVVIESRAYALLGACARARANGAGQAEALFKRAVDLALAAGDREAVAQAAYGSASAMHAQGRLNETLAKLGCLDDLLATLGLPELTSASRLLRGIVMRELDRVDDSLAAIWSGCEALRGDPHLVLYARTLIALSGSLIQKGQVKDARLYLELAEKSSRPDDMPALRRSLAKMFSKCGGADAVQEEAELVFDSRAGVLRMQGQDVRFEGQVMLRDLMRAFLERPGHAYTKSEIALIVWGQVYDPRVHDNKIYVTIKRLRRCLGDGLEGRRYVLRAKDGYLFNPKVRSRLL